MSMKPEPNWDYALTAALLIVMMIIGVGWL